MSTKDALIMKKIDTVATILQAASGTMIRTETLRYVEPTEPYAKTGPL